MSIDYILILNTTNGLENGIIYFIRAMKAKLVKPTKGSNIVACIGTSQVPHVSAFDFIKMNSQLH